MTDIAKPKLFGQKSFRKNRKVCLVGSSQATKDQAEKKIRQILSWEDSENTTIVNCDCKGIDRITNGIARELGFNVEIITQKTLGLKSNGRGEWFKNQELANNHSAEISDIAYSIALPLGTTEKRGRCTYCKKAGYPYNHEKTAGCRTAIKCNRHTTLVVGLNEEK